MKPTYAGIAASAALATSLFVAYQEGKGNTTEPTGQLSNAQIEAELKAMNVYKETVKAEDGTDVFDLSIDGVAVQLYAIPTDAGAPQYWRLSGGWDLSAAPRPDDVNKFNMASKQAFSYLDREYDPYLVMDQNIAAGSSVEILHSIVDSFRQALPDFKSIVLHNRA
jgi:hypothetical protein